MRPTQAYIDLNALEHNVVELKKLAGDRTFMAIVKANAYGHGDIEVVEKLYKIGIKHFGVATFEEAIKIRNVFHDIYIMVIGATMESDYGIAANRNIALAVHTIKNLEKIKEMELKPKIHIKIDTGMHRIGFSQDEFLLLYDYLKDMEVEGIFTHIARADEIFKSSANEQIGKFKEALDFFNDREIKFKYIHFANSASTIGLDLSFSNLVRCGIAMYGLNPSGERKLDTLKPILSLYTKVVAKRTISKGEGVSYSHIYKAEDETVVATLPIGYADGYKRNMSTKAVVYINGFRCPVIGRITMDQIMVDITDRSIEIDDDVELIGEHITADELAIYADTINYEIVTTLGERVRRIYIDKNKEK